jgi:hypothetical protein
MKRHKVRRTALLTLAMLFLALAWVWDGFIAVERWIVGRIPWTRLKLAFAALIDRLPAPAVLPIFLVPLLIVEPLLVLATVAIAMGYVVSGAIAWILLKVFGLGLIAAVFDLTQHRLMTMPWFAWVYRKFMAFYLYAHRIVAPYTHAARALIGQWRRRAAAAMRRLPGVAPLAARLAARRRAANGRPPLPFSG